MPRPMPTRPFCLGFLFLLLFGLWGCGDSEVNAVKIAEIDEKDGNPQGTPNRDDLYLLVPTTPKALTGSVGDSIELGAYLYNKKTGNPVGAEPIGFEVISGSQVGALSAKSTQTKEDGSATMVYRLDAAGTAVITMTHPSANEVEITIESQAKATGGIDVRLSNTAPTIMAITDIDVRFYLSVGYSCTEFLPLRRQPDALATKRAPTTETEVAFEDLDVSKKYLVTAVGKGPGGQLAAGGCQSDIRVAGDERTVVELPLQLIPMNPVGRYDVTANWDFTKALEDSGPVGGTIIRVLDVFENPGEAIYKEVINLVRAAVGGIISGTLNLFLDKTGLDDRFKALINNAVEGNKALRRVRDAGRDVRDVIANLEVHSELIIGKLSADYEFKGTDNWLGVRLYWRWNCDATSPPECGAIDLLIDGDSKGADLGVLSTQWTGRVVSYDQLQIDSHPITLRYGRLLIYILNDVIIPQLTDGNAHSMSEAFAYWIGCGSIASSITGKDGQLCALGACIYKDDVEKYCSSAIGGLFGFADALIGNLEFDVGLRVGGEAKMVEKTSDGYVDLLENGIFSGTLTSGGGANGQGTGVAPIKASWSGVLRDYKTKNQ